MTDKNAADYDRYHAGPDIDDSVWIEPWNSGLQSTPRALAGRLSRLLTALGEVNDNISDKKAVEVKRGTFQLTRTVENPTPNRRNKSDWTCEPEWTGGTYFIIDDFMVMKDEEPLPHVRRPNSHRGLTPSDPRFWLIVGRLEAVVERPSDLLARMGYSNWTSEVLNRLCANGCFTLEDVEKALAVELAEDQAEHDAKQAKKAEDK